MNDNQNNAKKLNKKKSKRFLPRFFKRSNSSSSDDSTGDTNNAIPSEGSGTDTPGMVKTDTNLRSGAGYGIAGITHQGYITLVEDGLFGPKHSRRYMLLLGNKLIWFRDKRSYEQRPEAPMNTRPVVLDNYTISTQKIDSGMYCIDLVPESSSDVKKIFHFRCDTLEEMIGWTNAFKTVLRTRSNSKTPLLNNSSSVKPSTGSGASVRTTSRTIRDDREEDAQTVVEDNERVGLLKGNSSK